MRLSRIAGTDVNKYLTKISELDRKGKLKSKSRPGTKIKTKPQSSSGKPGKQPQAASSGFFVAKGSAKAQAMVRLNRPTHQMSWAAMSDDTRKKK